MTRTGEAFAARLDIVAPQLEELAAATVPEGALTGEDEKTGERWEAGQAWAHLAEFVPYWIAHAQVVLGGRDSAPTPFGRTKADAHRVNAIESGRNESRDSHVATVRGDIGSLREFVVGLDDDDWTVTGLHPTLGEMSIAHIVEEFLVGHLEEHAEQLAALSS